MTIKDLPEHERPKEKLMYSGAGALSTSELLALVIRTGTGESGNILSLKLAENAAESIAYSTINEDGFANQVDVTIK